MFGMTRISRSVPNAFGKQLQPHTGSNRNQQFVAKLAMQFGGHGRNRLRFDRQQHDAQSVRQLAGCSPPHSIRS